MRGEKKENLGEKKAREEKGKPEKRRKMGVYKRYGKKIR